MHPVGRPHVPAGTGTRELVERDRELAYLAVRHAGAAVAGQVVAVSGEAGVGKTSLLREFGDRVGSPVLWGACDPLFTPRPLGPVVDVARQIHDETLSAAAAGAPPHEVVDALVHALARRPGSVLVLEDLHWADEATLDVVRLLARGIAAVPVLLVLTHRDDALDRTHPLRIVLGELSSSGIVGRLHLDTLTSQGVARLVGSDDVDVAELHRKTGGNPFFVQEVLSAGPAAGRIPDTVRDAVLARTSRLGPDAQAVLEAVAVVPRGCELWLLEGMVGERVRDADPCVEAGILVATADGVAYRHELARLAVAGSTTPARARDLNRRALRALSAPPDGVLDHGRLAQHADAARESAVVLEHAPQAASEAAAVGSHREAVALYQLALRHGGSLGPAERATMLGSLAGSCYVTDQYDTGIAALEEAVALYRGLGDALHEGDAHRELSKFLWCPGRITECTAAATEAVERLSTLPPGPELAWAYANMAHVCAADVRGAEALVWAARAIEVAHAVGADEAAVDAQVTMGVCNFAPDGPGQLQAAVARADRGGFPESAVRGRMLLGDVGIELGQLGLAAANLEAGLEIANERGLELNRLYLLAHRARLALAEARWSDAGDDARAVLRVPRTSNSPRIHALVVLGLVRARRGDPGVDEVLTEAWELARPTGELPRVAPVAIARAEAAWLAGDPATVAAVVQESLPLATDRGATVVVDSLLGWAARAGHDVGIPRPAGVVHAGPYAAALELVDRGTEEDLRQAVLDLQRIGAVRASAVVGQRLRAMGASGVPRGPRSTTRDNPAQLTQREVEVLGLLVGGLRNAEIAAALVLSTRTVDHHVATILRKLDVPTRAQAVLAATALGVVPEPG